MQDQAREQFRPKYEDLGDDKDDPGALGRYHAHRISEQLLATYQTRVIVPYCREQGDYEMADEQLRHALKHQQCRTSGLFGVNGNRNVVVAWDTKCCQSKYCPDEATKESKRLRERYEQAILDHDEAGGWVHKFWPTLKNYPAGRLKEGQRHIFKRFRDRLIRAQKKGENTFGIVGALCIEESPLSDARDWNVHLNCIILAKGSIDYQGLREQWGCNIEMRRHRDFSEEGMHNLFSEMVKYATRAIPEKSNDGRHTAPAMIEWTPPEYLEYYRANKGFRRTRAYGSLHGIGKPDKDITYPEIWLGRLAHRPSGYAVNWRKHDYQDVLRAVAEKAGPYAGLGLDSIRGNKSTRANIYRGPP